MGETYWAVFGLRGEMRPETIRKTRDESIGAWMRAICHARNEWRDHAYTIGYRCRKVKVTPHE